MRISKVLLTTLLAFFLFSCSSSQPKINDEMNEAFRKLIQIDDLNSTLLVQISSRNPSKVRFGSDITVVVENTSEQTVFLPADSSVTRIFILRNDQWIEIQDKYITIGDGSYLLPKGHLESQWLTRVRPVYNLESNKIQNPEVVRILFSGELLSGNEFTGIIVGAYVDLFVHH